MALQAYDRPRWIKSDWLTYLKQSPWPDKDRAHFSYLDTVKGLRELTDTEFYFFEAYRERYKL